MRQKDLMYSEEIYRLREKIKDLKGMIGGIIIVICLMALALMLLGLKVF